MQKLTLIDKTSKHVLNLATIHVMLNLKMKSEINQKK